MFNNLNYSSGLFFKFWKSNVTEIGYIRSANQSIYIGSLGGGESPRAQAQSKVIDHQKGGTL